ncbi:hypothetical protein J6590_102126 [Homalodisca vitripennis]|nr:hypothetical protein J6590_102126 [Homalodisca vitripennis]
MLTYERTPKAVRLFLTGLGDVQDGSCVCVDAPKCQAEVDGYNLARRRRHRPRWPDVTPPPLTPPTVLPPHSSSSTSAP